MTLYPWLAPLYQTIIMQQRARPHPAHLIYALPGYGVDSLLQAVAAWLLCCHPKDTFACQQCRACRFMKTHNHPDWRVVKAEQSKRWISVEQIRALIDWLYRCSQQNGAKVVAFNASELNIAAMQALLKTLEEPPENTFFLLTSQNSASLLPTLRSRCQQWMLGNTTHTTALQWLQKQHPTVDDQQLMLVLSLTSGAPLAAYELLRGSLLQKRLQLCCALYKALQKHDFMYLFADLNDTEPLQLLQWLATLWLDAVKTRQQLTTAIQHSDQRALISLLVNSFTLQQLHYGCRLSLRCRHELSSQPHLNQPLLLTELLCRHQEMYSKKGHTDVLS